jgi:hypothetical protein
MAASTRVWLLAAALACVLLVSSADAAPEPATRSTVLGCTPLTDKACNNVMSRAALDLDGDGEEDEVPNFTAHFNILGHGH